MKKREQTVYERYIKRVLDLIWAILAIVVFWWLYIIIAILVKIKLGSPVIFKQQRPGLNEKVFSLYKFRTMTDERDKNGNLMPDEVRLTKFGKWLRSTSLDELPEVFNIINGDMSVIGPRPQLVRDMVFMTEEQRERHSVRPGLSGLAQVNGRNAISWENKLKYDLEYIQKITFRGDVKIILQTVMKAFVKQEGINREGTVSDMDFGDYLLQEEKVDQDKYDRLQLCAKQILTVGHKITKNEKEEQKELVSIITPSYNTGRYISKTIESVLNQTYENWEMLIVDDGSTDNTDEVVKGYLHDSRIRYLKNEKNSGAAISRNRALREANGRWIAFLDSDDLWNSEKLEKQVRFMKDHNYHFSYTNYEEIDEEDNTLGVKVTGPKRISKSRMVNYCYPGCLTVMYDSSYVGEIQIKDIKKNNDYAMWIEISRKENCWLLDEYLGKYRKRNGSISNHSIGTMVRWHYRLWNKAVGKNCLISFWYTGCNLFFGFFKKILYVKRESK